MFKITKRYAHRARLEALRPTVNGASPPPERGPQSDEGHPSRRGVSSRPGIDKAPEVAVTVWERGKLPEDGGMLPWEPGRKTKRK